MKPIKIKLTIAFDGALYAGWQVQKTGLGVQQRIEDACRNFFPGFQRLHSSSRTDTGVHALGMVAHFEIPESDWNMAISKLPLALNSQLPPDIRIMSASLCRENFHARFDATGKQYRYFVWNHYALNPLIRHQAWLVPKKLDLLSMRTAALLFIGKHDFESFAANRNYKARSTIRTLKRCDIKKSGPLLTFIIEADGFLYKMCRGIVGTLVQVGQGRFQAQDIKKILAKKDRRVAGMTAPAAGLVLWKVFY